MPIVNLLKYLFPEGVDKNEVTEESFKKLFADVYASFNTTSLGTRESYPPPRNKKKFLDLILEKEGCVQISDDVAVDLSKVYTFLRKYIQASESEGCSGCVNLRSIKPEQDSGISFCPEKGDSAESAQNYLKMLNEPQTEFVKAYWKKGCESYTPRLSPIEKVLGIEG